MFLLYSILSTCFVIYLFSNVIYIPVRPSKPTVKLPIRNYQLLQQYEEKYDKPDIYLFSPRISYQEFKTRDNDRYSRDSKNFDKIHDNYDKSYRKYRTDAYKFLEEIRSNY